MVFKTYADLNNDIINNIYKIPSDIDLVVGIPRSGLLVANIISLYMNKPLSDIDSFIDGKIYQCGITKNTNNIELDIINIHKILIVDDSVSSGKSLEQAKLKVQEIKQKLEIIYFTVYTRTETKKLTDIYCTIIDEKRVFEWNYMHNIHLENACVDIDGVLCIDPTEEENDDGENYKRFIENATPKLLPTRKIGNIVTSRLEKYRTETEQWLEKNHIQYGNLIMMNLKSAEERRKLGNHGDFKATVYKNISSAEWFIESNPVQANEINKKTGKFVFCVENQKCYCENSVNRVKIEIKQNIPQKIKVRIKKSCPPKILYLIHKLKKLNENRKNKKYN